MKKIALSILVITQLFSKDMIDNNQTSPLLPLKNEIIDIRQKATQEKEKVNKYQWIGEINLNASTSENQDDVRSEDYSMSFTQEIFNFGGIDAQMDYASSLKKLELLEISIDNNADLLSLYQNLIDLEINKLNIKRNQLNINNSEIDVDIKKSSYNQGESDISDLNDAIMTRNSYEDAKMELEVAQVELINNIKKLTDLELDTLFIPNVNLMDKKSYLQYSSTISLAKYTTQTSKEEYRITKSDYLPSLKLNASYGYRDSDIINGDDYYSYGASVSMPLNLTALNAIEYGKLQFLQNEKESKLTTLEVEKNYDTSVAILKQYDRRIQLANKDIDLYKELVELNTDEYNAGFKAKEDVLILQNSQEIRQIDIKIYSLSKKRELLSLYFEQI